MEFKKFFDGFCDILYLPMDTTALLAQANNSNSIFGSSILGSKYLSPDFWFGQEVNLAHNFSEHVFRTEVLSFLHVILFLLGVFFIALICYCSVRLLEIRKKEHAHLHHEMHEYAHHQAERESKLKESEEISKNPRWITVINYLYSGNPGDWKLAVIEADSMLEELMGERGFTGATLGDKLKSANQANFRNLTNAWEVHTIRNRIAHEGGSFELSEREAKRVIAIYEQIFREFGHI